MAERIFLVRHATALPPGPPRYIGSTDPGLTAAGLKEAESLAEPIGERNPRLCLCSPLRRAVQTAARATAGLNLPIETLPELREINFGRWEGKSFEEIREEAPQKVAEWVEKPDGFRFPGGEAVRDFYVRVEGVGERLLGEMADPLLVVTHGGVIKALICSLAGLPFAGRLAFRVDPASISTVEVLEGHGVLTGLNNTGHLRTM